MREAIPSGYKSNMAYYWRTRDIGYVRNVFELALAPDCELPSNISFFDPRAIALDTSPFHPDGVPYSGQYANVSYERYMPLSEQEAERHARHMRECFIPALMTKYQSYRGNVSGSIYVPLPSWYYDYEIPYPFAHETSPLVAYFGRKLMKADNAQLGVILLNEQLIFQAVTLVNWAREGRLYLLPPGCISGLRQRGLNRVCFGAEALADQLGELLNEIELIRWDRVPERRGDQPQHAGRITSVYLNGYWVPFDAAEWRTRLNDADVRAQMKTTGEMYLPLNPNGIHAYPQQDRGVRVHGFVSRFRENPTSAEHADFERAEDGFAKNNDARANSAEVPLNDGQVKRLERFVNSYLHNDPARAETEKDTATLLKECGYEPMVTMERVVHLVRRGFYAERLNNLGRNQQRGAAGSSAGAQTNEETEEPGEVPISVELLDAPVSSMGVPLAMPNPAITTTMVITVEEPVMSAPADPSRMEVNVPSPPGAPPAVIEISDDEPAANAGTSGSMGVARPIGRRTRQPYAAAPSAGSRVNVRARSPDSEEEESRGIKRRRVA